MPGVSYLSENYGKVQLVSALAVLGPTDHGYPVRGPVEKAALDLWQPAGNPHKIRWLVKDGASAATLHADPSDGTFLKHHEIHRAEFTLESLVRLARRRLDLEPDGVQRRQEHQGEDRSAERATDQRVRQRSPKH